MAGVLMGFSHMHLVVLPLGVTADPAPAWGSQVERSCFQVAAPNEF
jgi:hypothetical protein